MRENLQNSGVGLARRLERIEELIGNKEYVSALAEIREIQNSVRFDSFSLEAGEFYNLSAKVFRHLGSYRESLEAGQRAISVFTELHDEQRIAYTQYILGLNYIGIGDLKSAEREVRDALTILRRGNDLRGIVDCLSRLSQIEFIRGNYSKSIEYIQDALPYGEKAFEPVKRAFLYGNLGMRYLMVGNWKEAEKNLILNTNLNRKAKNELNLCRGLLSLGFVYFLKREFVKSLDSFEESLLLIQKNNCVRELAIYHEYAGALTFAEEDYESAFQHYDKALEIGEKIAPQSGIISQTCRLLAELQVAKKECDLALNSCLRALQVSISLGERVEEGACYRILGQIYTVKGDKEKAQENFHKSLNILEEIQAKYELAKTYLEAGKSGCLDYYERLKYLGRAEDIFKNLESKYHLASVNLALSQLFFENREYEKSELFLKDAEKVFRELGEERDLNSILEFRNKLNKFSGELEVIDPEEKYTFSQIITQNKEMLDILEKAKQIKDTNMTVLIEGETGTGKDLLAKCIHYESKRKDKNFVVVSCAAIPEALLESELFGHRKGAFTGASYDKKGLLEEADEGTLFLNEVADLPWLIQAKLLGVIENKELTRLGETRSRKVDFRIIAASNKALQEEIKSGRFRNDLYYRLRVIRFVLPPLRQRREDIPLLLTHFTALYSDNGDSASGDDLLEVFLHHSWPGNVRELQNQVQRIIFLGDGKGQSHGSEVTELLASGKERSSQGSLNELVANYEKEQIVNALKNCDGTVIQAARLLGVPWTTLKNKIKKYNLELPN